MRGEILRDRKIASAIFFLSFLGITTQLQAQSLPESIISMIENHAENLSESSYEELVDRLEYFYEHPIAINSASRDELEELGLLNLFQIESLIDHIEQFGDILSSGELSIVDGFNKNIISQIEPFISYESDYSIGEVDREKRLETEIIAKGKRKWGNDFALTSKIALNYDRHSVGITLDNDAGEHLSRYYLPDFTSFHYEYRNNRYNIVVGDYVAKFGQGLTLWKSFPISFVSTPSSMAKRGKGLSGYTSTDEDNYLRGLAASAQFGSSTVSILLSARNIDARVVDDYYTSIVTGGIHVSDAEMAKRHTMWEYLAGTNYTIKLNSLKLGITAVAYMYDKHNGRRVYDYNRYQIYDGLWGDVGVDFLWHHNHCRYFGELAIDAHAAPAMIVGMVYNPKYEVESCTTFRYYDKSFISTHSGAFSTISSVSNQLGLTYNLKWLASDSFTINYYSDLVYYPWVRFNIDSSSSSIKSKISFEYSKENKWQLTLMLNGKIARETEIYYNYSASLKVKYYCGNRFELEGIGSYNSGGYAACIGATFSTERKRLQVSGRVTKYDTSDWNSRIYLYEKGMPQTYSVEAFYGKGWSEYLMLKYSPSKKYNFYIKVSDRYSAFFIRIFIPG